MSKAVSPLVDFDLEVFQEELTMFKQEIAQEEDESQKGFYAELINLLEEEIAKRKGKAISINLRSDIQFFAYINLFHTLVNGDMYDDEFEDFDEELEETEEEK